jgi:membrane protease YdiL (CAAX protease family)
MNLLDHGLVFIIAIVYPITGFIGFRRLLMRVAAGEPVKRLELYRNTLIGHWTLFFIFAAIWLATAREWSAIGLDLDLDLRAGVGAMLTLLGIVILVMQIRQVKNATQEEIDGISRRFGKLAIIIPHNGSELARFYGLAVTAGIVEEILWRGFLIWYLTQFMPLWAAAVISTVGFALAHAYQGLANLPQITAVSAVLAALYLISGSIWFPIVLHAAVDILQGRLGYDVMYRSMVGGSAAESGGD